MAKLIILILAFISIAFFSCKNKDDEVLQNALTNQNWDSIHVASGDSTFITIRDNDSSVLD